MDELRSVLEHTLTVNDTITFDSLRIKDQFPPFTPPLELTTTYPNLLGSSIFPQ